MQLLVYAKLSALKVPTLCDDYLRMYIQQAIRKPTLMCINHLLDIYTKVTSVAALAESTA